MEDKAEKQNFVITFPEVVDVIKISTDAPFEDIEVSFWTGLKWVKIEPEMIDTRW